MAGRVLIVVSATPGEAAALLKDGPRRDFIELSAATGGEIVYRDGGARRKGLRGKLWGPHLRQAWRVASGTRPGDAIFADGEHNGLPLVLFLALRRRRPGRVVMLGHLLSRPWKLPLLWLATHAGPRGVLVLHSLEQRRNVRRWVGSRWQVRLVPYQVDTAFWLPAEAVPDGIPVVVAAGSENRDYETLVQAVRGLPVDVVIAAGSHWARNLADPRELPANVELLSRPLPFADLRELYRRAAVVVVPVHDVPNQSGVTTILEAMSCGRPVIVTASRGQQECIEAPLVRSDGTLDAAATSSRGPAAFGGAPGESVSGLYVPPGDSAALRAAVSLVTRDGEWARAMGRAGRAAAVRDFDIERFVDTLRGALLDPLPAAATRTRSPLASR